MSDVEVTKCSLIYSKLKETANIDTSIGTLLFFSTIDFNKEDPKLTIYGYSKWNKDGSIDYVPYK